MRWSQEIGITADDFNFDYSWTTGAVIVPAYDSSSEAEGITINANMALILAVSPSLRGM
ncbi:MAG: hypothetical protein V3S84_03030 [Dehalococcoidales bacterium]